MHDDPTRAELKELAAQIKSETHDAAAGATEAAQKAARRAGDQAQAGAAAVQDALRHSLNAMTEAMHKVQTQLSEFAGSLRGSADQARDVLSGRGRDAAADLGEKVREAPLASLMIAAAAGFALAMLTRRD